MHGLCRENDVAVTVYPILVSSAVPTRAWTPVYARTRQSIPVPHSMTDTDRYCTVLSTVAPRNLNSPGCFEFRATLDPVDRISHSIGIASQPEVTTILPWLAAVLTSLPQLKGTGASSVVTWHHDPQGCTSGANSNSPFKL